MQQRAKSLLILSAGALLIGHLGCAKDATDAEDLLGRAGRNSGDEQDASISDSGQGNGGNSGAGGGNGIGAQNTGGLAAGGGSNAGAAGDSMLSPDAGGNGCFGGCDDGSDCTTDSCMLDECVHEDNGTCECLGPEDCDDQDECTDNLCTAGACEYPANTAPCTDDGNACTDDVCGGGVCTHPNNTEPCADEGNECTEDVCTNGGCTHVALAGTPACTTDNKDCTPDLCIGGVCNHNPALCDCNVASDCNDNEPCTDDDCVGGVCANIANTDPCVDDGNACTGTGVCANKICTHPNITAPCATDSNACTDDVCSGGLCTHVSNTLACTNDSNACTDDVCGGGTCNHSLSASCECLSPADCTDDGNPCTDTGCDGSGNCTHTNNTAPCTDDGLVCTTDICAGGTCTHPNNTAPCATDGDPCTNDVCSSGVCDHSTFNTAPCATDGDPCTSDLCNGAGVCQHTPVSCGAPFTINSFNSSANWTANLTTPDLRALTKAGFTGTNLEGNQNVYLAASATSTVTMDVANMTGLTSIDLLIVSDSSGTSGMVQVGVYNGTIWTELTVSTYGTIAQDAAAPYTYAAIQIPLADFGVTLSQITQVRIEFNPTGGQQIWRIDNIAVN